MNFKFIEKLNITYYSKLVQFQNSNHAYFICIVIKINDLHYILRALKIRLWPKVGPVACNKIKMNKKFNLQHSVKVEL